MYVLTPKKQKLSTKQYIYGEIMSTSIQRLKELANIFHIRPRKIPMPVRIIVFKCKVGHFTKCASKKREFFCKLCNTFFDKKDCTKYTDGRKGLWGVGKRDKIIIKNRVLCPVTQSHYRKYPRRRMQQGII